MSFHAFVKYQSCISFDGKGDAHCTYYGELLGQVNLTLELNYVVLACCLKPAKTHSCSLLESAFFTVAKTDVT